MEQEIRQVKYVRDMFEKNCVISVKSAFRYKCVIVILILIAIGFGFVDFISIFQASKYLIVLRIYVFFLAIFLASSLICFFYQIDYAFIQYRRLGAKEIILLKKQVIKWLNDLIFYTGYQNCLPARYMILYSNLAFIILSLDFYNKYELIREQAHDETIIIENVFGDFEQYFAVVLSIILLLILIILEFLFKCNQNEEEDNDYIPSNYQQQQVKYKAKYFLIVSMLYSMFKIIILLVTIKVDDDDSSIILVCSNLYFHLLMIILGGYTYAYIKNIHVSINPKNTCLNFNDYFSLIDTVFYEIAPKSRILLIFIFLSLPFTIVGHYFYDKVQQTGHANFYYFYQYDCIGMQIFAVSMITIMYLILPCCNGAPEPMNYDISENRGENQEAETNIRQQVPQQQFQAHNQVYSENQFDHIQMIPPQKKIKILLEPINTSNSNYFVVRLNNSECTICLQEMVSDSQMLMELKCHKTHVFHKTCIEQWLYLHSKCPICNAKQ